MKSLILLSIVLLSTSLSLFSMDTSLTYEPSDLFSNEPWELTIALDGSTMPQVRADYVPPLWHIIDQGRVRPSHLPVNGLL